MALSSLEVKTERIKLFDSQQVQHDIKSFIESLNKAMEAGFASLRTDFDKLRQEFKHEIEEMKSEVTSLKESMIFTQSEVDKLKEKWKENTEEMKDGLENLSMKVAQLEKKLESAVEENIKLEQYTQRENLCFTELEGEDCKALICGVIQNEMGLDESNIKSRQFTGWARKSRTDADPSSPALSAVKTGTKPGAKEVR